MLNNRHPNKERFRIEFNKKTLNLASNYAATNGETLSGYVEWLVETDLGEFNE